MIPQAETVTIELPTTVYLQLLEMANERQSNPVELTTIWVESVKQQQSWRKGWADLQRQVQMSKHILETEDGVDSTETIVAQVRKTRQEIFDAEYAHLYR